MTFTLYGPSQKIGMQNNTAVFKGMKTKGHEQDKQNRLRSPMV